MTGMLKEITRSLEGKQILQITLDGDFSEEFDDLKDKVVDVNIKQYRKIRSNEANRMCWKMVMQITEKLQAKEPRHGWTMTEVYRNAIRDVAGACSIHCLPNDQVDEFVEDWISLGLGFQVELFPSKIDGCTNGMFWKGSHLFNTKQMSTLIDILIQEAEQQGIHTYPDEKERKEALEAWKKGGRKGE